MDDAEARDFFITLKSQVESDQAILEKLLRSLKMNSSGPLLVASEVTSRIGRLRLMWKGFKPGEMGLLEGLELLALGIQGKRLLWLALKELSPLYPEWNDVDFTTLELEAIRQRDGVEKRRLQAVRKTLPSSERKAMPPKIQI
ncbi:MAG: hypothetical protein V4640_08445 [Verrucomicrobiota bacterium]